MKKIFTLLSFSLFLCYSFVYSQTQDEPKTITKFDKYEQQDFLDIKKGWYLSLEIGANFLYGDVTNFGYVPKAKDLSRNTSKDIIFTSGKRLKYGIAAELQVNKGTINGFKSDGIVNANKYIQSRTNFFDISINARYPISDLIFREISKRETGGKFLKRFTIFGTLGPGVIFYRSNLSYFTTGRVISYYGYEPTVINGGYNTLKGIKRNNNFEINTGLKFNYKLNFKADVFLGFRYSYVFTDKLDAFVRPVGSKDNYASFTVGLVFNLGRTEEDDLPKEWRATPSNERKKNKQNKNKSKYEDDTESSSDGKTSKKESKRKQAETDDFLKSFDAQLKLFELQRQLEQNKKP